MSTRKYTPRQPVKPTLNAGDYKKLIKEASENLVVYIKNYNKPRSHKEQLEILIKASANDIKRYVDEMVAIAIKPEESKEKEEVKKKVKKEIKKEVKKEDNDNDNYDYDSII